MSNLEEARENIEKLKEGKYRFRSRKLKEIELMLLLEEVLAVKNLANEIVNISAEGKKDREIAVVNDQTVEELRSILMYVTGTEPLVGLEVMKPQEITSNPGLVLNEVKERIEYLEEMNSSYVGRYKQLTEERDFYYGKVMTVIKVLGMKEESTEEVVRLAKEALGFDKEKQDLETSK